MRIGKTKLMLRLIIDVDDYVYSDYLFICKIMNLDTLKLFGAGISASPRTSIKNTESQTLRRDVIGHIEPSSFIFSPCGFGIAVPAPH